jgi:hypothetical protein
MDPRLYDATAIASGFVPGSGLMDFIGQAPAIGGGMGPSFMQNIRDKQYLDALLQTAGAAGDALMVLPPVGMTVKAATTAGKTARAGSKTADALAATKKAAKITDTGAIKAPAKSNMRAANRQKFGDVVPTVANPQRAAFPGIYKDPRVIAAEAAANTVPEARSLFDLFGVTRSDMASVARNRQGNQPSITNFAARPKGSEAAENVMTRPNTQRIVDALAEAEKYPELATGMDAWYVMDPAFQRLVQLVGKDEAVKRYNQFNTLSGMASPGSDVLTELNRGSAANYLATQGRFGDFMKYGGVAEANRGADFPADMVGVMSHPYHSTAQAGPMQKFISSGRMEMDSPKVPLYVQSAGVPETGFQTALPVGDAHWSRGVGLADTRNTQMRKGVEVVPGASVSNTELQTLGDWWKNNIAGELGIESVPAQARAWGTFARQTGVETPVGAPKLELLAQKIMQTAQQTGLSPELVRDRVLMGEMWLSGRGGLLDEIGK